MIEQYPFALENESFNAAIVRRATQFFLTRGSNGIGSVAGGYVGSVSGTQDCIVTAPASGMSFNIGTGQCVVPGTSVPTQSGYPVNVTSSTNVAVSTANATNPRLDLAVLTVNDTAYSAASDGAIGQDILGTPAGSPIAPSLPTSSYALADITVPAAATSITSGDITNVALLATLGVSLFAPVEISGSASVGAAPNQSFLCSGTPFITMPEPALGVVVKVTNTGTSTVTTISSYNTDKFYGKGLNGVSGSCQLAGVGTTATFECLDGANWYVTAGELDTGWLTASLENSWVAASGGSPVSYQTPQYRLIGNQVTMRGQMSGGTNASTAFNLSTIFQPAAPLRIPVMDLTPDLDYLLITTDVIVYTITGSVTTGVSLDGVSYLTD